MLVLLLQFNVVHSIAPWDDSRKAVALPRPWAPPVTKATIFERDMGDESVTLLLDLDESKNDLASRTKEQH